MSVFNNLISLRKKFNYSQQEIADKLGITRQTYIKMEKNDKMELLKKLASTRSHGRRGRMPSAKKQRRGRMADTTTRLEENTYDAVP